METWGGSDGFWGLGGTVGGGLKKWQLGKIVFEDYWKGRGQHSNRRGFKEDGCGIKEDGRGLASE